MRTDRSRCAIASSLVTLVLLAVPAATPAADAEAKPADRVPAVGGPPVDDPTYGDFTTYRFDIKAVQAYFDTLDVLTVLPGELHKQMAVEKNADETIHGIVEKLKTADPRVLNAIADGGLTLYDYVMVGNTVMDSYVAIHSGKDAPKNVNPDNLELVRNNWKVINTRYNAVRQRVVQTARERTDHP